MRSSLIYLLLVGAPLVALIAVMRVGESIVPPRYIGGIWQFQFDSAACAVPDEVEIAQSGIVLELHFERDAAGTDARLQGAEIRSSEVDFSPACKGKWRMDSRVDGAEGRERLVGRWMPVDCDTCSPVAFTAVKIAGDESIQR